MGVNHGAVVWGERRRPTKVWPFAIAVDEMGEFCDETKVRLCGATNAFVHDSGKAQRLSRICLQISRTVSTDRGVKVWLIMCEHD